MNAAEQMYPDFGREGYFWGASDYTPILEACGAVVARADDDDYQGDTFAVVADPSAADRFGFVQIGWGSCSGCDALQACESYGEIDALAADIASRIRWGTGAETLAYLDGAEARVEYYAESATFRAMRDAFRALPLVVRS